MCNHRLRFLIRSCLQGHPLKGVEKVTDKMSAREKSAARETTQTHFCSDPAVRSNLSTIQYTASCLDVSAFKQFLKVTHQCTAVLATFTELSLGHFAEQGIVELLSQPRSRRFDMWHSKVQFYTEPNSQLWHWNFYIGVLLFETQLTLKETQLFSHPASTKFWPTGIVNTLAGGIPLWRSALSKCEFGHEMDLNWSIYMGIWWYYKNMRTQVILEVWEDIISWIWGKVIISWGKEWGLKQQSHLCNI